MRNIFILAALAIALLPAGLRAQDLKKDYLSAAEADKIRDAETPNERIKLFISFADDRLKKFQYELEHPSPNRHGDVLNFMLNAYVGCIDDAADLIQLGIEKQENVRQGIDAMTSRSKEFLAILQKLANEGAEAADSCGPADGHARQRLSGRAQEARREKAGRGQGGRQEARRGQAG